MFGKLALIGANASLMLLLANRLALGVYGLLVAVIGAQLLLSRVLMLGVDSGMIRLRRIPDLDGRSRDIVSAGLMVMWCTSSILAFAAIVVGPVLSWTAASWWVLSSVVAGALGTALVDYAFCFRLAQTEYRAAALVQGGTAVVRLALTALAVTLFPEYPPPVFVTYAVVSLLSGVLLTAALIGGSRARPEGALVWRLLRYSVWQGVANVVVILSLYQGVFLLLVLGRDAASGVFGLALTLSLGFFAVYNAFYEYLFSRVVRADSLDALRRFLLRACAAALAVTLGCAPVALAIGVLAPRFLRPELEGMVLVFYYLTASMLVLILQAPFEAACHYLLRPHLVLCGWVFRVVCIGLLGLVLSPIGGPVGAAVAQFSGAGIALFVVASGVGLYAHSGR